MKGLFLVWYGDEIASDSFTEGREKENTKATKGKVLQIPTKLYTLNCQTLKADVLTNQHHIKSSVVQFPSKPSMFKTKTHEVCEYNLLNLSQQQTITYFRYGNLDVNTKYENITIK